MGLPRIPRTTDSLRIAETATAFLAGTIDPTLSDRENRREIQRSTSRTALGRSSLLSSQPDQPGAPSCERAELSHRLCAGLFRSGGLRADRLARRDDHAPGRTFLLRA